MKVVITGTSKGIGKAIARKFLDMGCLVTGIDVLPPSLSHPAYTHCTADILSGELPDTEAEILINNAGVQDSGRDIDVNLKGSIRVTEFYLRYRPKSVVFIASASASTGSEFPAYAASKGGLVSYMKNVALRAAEWGGTANSVSPGGVTTELNRRVMEDQALWGQIMDETPLKKWASPEEIAEWVYFVAVVNRSMTAQDLLIDNGESARAKFVW